MGQTEQSLRYHLLNKKHDPTLFRVGVEKELDRWVRTAPRGFPGLVKCPLSFTYDAGFVHSRPFSKQRPWRLLLARGEYVTTCSVACEEITNDSSQERSFSELEARSSRNVRPRQHSLSTEPRQLPNFDQSTQMNATQRTHSVFKSDADPFYPPNAIQDTTTPAGEMLFQIIYLCRGIDRFVESPRQCRTISEFCFLASQACYLFCQS